MKKVSPPLVFISNEEMLDRFIGKIGTKARDTFDKKVAKAVAKKNSK